MVTWVAWQKAALNLNHTCIVSPVLMFVPVLPPPLERNSVGPCSVSGVLKDSSGSHPGPDAHGHHPVGPLPTALQLIKERDDLSSSSAAQRVAQGHCTPERVHLLGGES